MDSNEALSRIKSHVSARSIDIKYELNLLDKRHSGFVNENQFFQFFTQINFTLFPALTKFLRENYSTEKGVDIKKFVEDVLASKPVDTLYRTDTLSMLKELQKLKRFLLQRSTTLRELFKLIDPSNRGTVSLNSFFRELGYEPSIKLIAQRYTFDGYGSVNYHKLAKDLDELPEYIGEKPDLTKIATDTQSRGVDLYSVFDSYDSHKTGRVSKDTFQYVLRSLNVENAEDIANFYTDCDGLCNCRKFCTDVDVIQTNVLPTYRPRVAEAIPIDVDRVIEDIKRACNDRRIKVHDYFQRYSGLETMTPVHFALIINSMNLPLTHDERNALINRFLDRSTNQVDFKKFLDLFYVPIPRSLEDGVTKLKNQLAAAKLQLAPILYRFDLERSGSISLQQLTSVLNKYNIRYTNDDLRHIVQQFPGVGSLSVKWRALCDHCDWVDPNPPSPKIDKVEEPKNTRVISPDLVPLLQKINFFNHRNNIHLEDDLRESDSRKSGFIRISLFFDLLRHMGVVFSSSEQAILTREYSQGSCYFNYYLLLRDLSLKECLIRPAELMAKPHDITEEQRMAIRRFKAFLIVRSMTVIDVFEPYDSNNNRTVLCSRVLTGMNTAGYRPPRSGDIQLIIDAFRDDKRKEYINYARLDTAVQNEYVAPEDVKGLLEQEDIEDKFKASLYICLGEINQKALARNVPLTLLFSGCNDLISRREFDERISRLNIVIDPRELDLIENNFSREGGIDWKSFCRETANIKTIAPILV